MTYPFVAAPDHWPRGGVPIRAIVIHMAQGGGTVSWLARPDGNSSHYVVEYSGRVVQMVEEARAAGSINPTLLRTTDDAPFAYLGETITYGVTAAKAALGQYWSNPNAAVIAIEIEGYAGTAPATANPLAEDLGGPNAAQRASLAALVADIRSRHGNLPALGHRDFQSYKACPGQRIPWADFGGHGLLEVDMQITAIKGEDWTPTVTNGQSNGVYRASPDRAAPIVARLPAGTVIRTIAEVTANGSAWRLSEIGGTPVYFLRTDLSPLVPGGDPSVDAILTGYIARTLPDERSIRVTEYDRVTSGTSQTLTFPPRP